MDQKRRATSNRTLSLSARERPQLQRRLLDTNDVDHTTRDVTVLGDGCRVAARLAPGSVDLLFLDPPYNLSKSIGGQTYSKRNVDDYTVWLGRVLDDCRPALSATATVYICGDWLTSQSIYAAAEPRLRVRNRITWERDKGRGSKTNWKAASEDIWFCTVGDDYTFNADAVKIRRRVVAPYRENGAPKDWTEAAEGNYRDTHPSNLWTDITVPFWSMPENTDHPTQKSEKLLAKLILASTAPGDFVFDPFLGSGTTSVVALKLARRFIGAETVEDYALIAQKRLELARDDQAIQGFRDGVFHHRNAPNARRRRAQVGGSRTPPLSVS